jgi:hypothetical protein
MLITRRILLALSAVLLSFVVFSSAALAAAGPTVKVRVVGESSTLLPLTSVTLEQPEPASGCPADSATAAINLAVDGNWDHGEAEGSDGDFTKTILGETEEYSNDSATWAVWINDKWAGGICEDILSEGDELLLIADHEPEPYAPTVLPLAVSEVPSVAVAGTQFKVVVDEVHTRAGTFPEVGEGTPEPAQGVTVSAGGSTATTGSDGSATLTIPAAGTYTLTASEPGAAPAAPVSICVRESNQSGCGVTVTAGSTSTSSSGSTSTSTSSALGVPGNPYKGPYALVPSLTSVGEGRLYSRRDAPRLLAGTVLTHSAVSSVSLELRRQYKGRCSTYDGTSDRFVKVRCGSGDLFKASNGGAFSYLLPAALSPGRYVLDVQASDVTGNHTTLARGSSRIVFYVR